jgi:hypothetical protein
MSALNDGGEFKRFLPYLQTGLQCSDGSYLSSTFFAITIRCAELIKLRRTRSEVF